MAEPPWHDPEVQASPYGHSALALHGVMQRDEVGSQVSV
jgi:hypothetical protein